MANLVEAAKKSLNGESVNEGMRPFSSSELSQLKAAYGKINRVDPESPTYKKLIDRLDGMSKEHLKQVRDAKIKFLSLLAANRLRNLGEDAVKGGLADKMTDEDLAKKHGVSVKEIKAQIAKGEKVEMEHTNDKVLAGEIARDHVFEDPKYYDKLATIENEEYSLEEGVALEDPVYYQLTKHFIQNGEVPNGSLVFHLSQDARGREVRAAMEVIKDLSKRNKLTPMKTDPSGFLWEIPSSLRNKKTDRLWQYIDPKTTHIHLSRGSDWMTYGS